MSTEVLAVADSLFVGEGQDHALAHVFGSSGVKTTPKGLFSLGTPALADVDYIIKAATGAELPNATTTTYDAVDDADASPVDAAATRTLAYFPFGTATQNAVWPVSDGATYGRNVSVNVTHASSIVAMTVTVSGYDYLGRAMSELFDVTATGTDKTVVGQKAFASVESVAITAAADATANTLNVGTGSVLGLPFLLEKAGYMTAASIGGVQETVGAAAASGVCGVVAGDSTDPATTSTGDVRGTVEFNTALDGSKEPVVEYYVGGYNTGAGLAGLAQA